MSAVLAAAGSGRTLWYLTRGTGIVALLLLTAVVVLGVSGTSRWSTERLPRFVVAGLHRNLSLLSIVFLALHVLTTIGDGFAPIGLKDAVIPFASPYRPVWLGLGTVAFDLLLALTVTSMLRGRLGLRTWRAVHWLAYAAWPIALVHALGTGSDARVGWMALLAAVCTGAVAVAVLWRVAAGGAVWTAGRAFGAGGAVLVPLALFIWYLGGPGSPGWATRSGTPATLLGTGAGAAAAVPAPPFAGALRGTIVQSRPDASGQVTVSIDAVAGAERIRVWMRGAPLEGGGIHVYDSRVLFGTAEVPGLYVGTLDSLAGTRLDAVLRSGSGAALDLALTLGIDRARGTVSGSFRGTAASGASALGAGTRRMSDAAYREETSRAAAPAGLPRLLAGVRADGRAVSLDAHLRRYGAPPAVRGRGAGAKLIEVVAASGLRGRGGAGFPTARKLEAVAARRGRSVVVANGTEGEPPSGKDKVLLAYLPHLVLDGAVLAAHAVGAKEAIVAVGRATPRRRRSCDCGAAARAARRRRVATRRVRPGAVRRR